MIFVVQMVSFYYTLNIALLCVVFFVDVAVVFLLAPLISSFRDTLASCSCWHCYPLVRIVKRTPRNQENFIIFNKSTPTNIIRSKDAKADIYLYIVKRTPKNQDNFIIFNKSTATNIIRSKDAKADIYLYIVKRTPRNQYDFIIFKESTKTCITRSNDAKADTYLYIVKHTPQNQYDFIIFNKSTTTNIIRPNDAKVYSKKDFWPWDLGTCQLCVKSSFRIQQTCQCNDLYIIAIIASLTVTCARGKLQAFASPKLQTPRTMKLSLLRFAVVHACPANRPHS